MIEEQKQYCVDSFVCIKCGAINNIPETINIKDFKCWYCGGDEFKLSDNDNNFLINKNSN